MAKVCLYSCTPALLGNPLNNNHKPLQPCLTYTPSTARLSSSCISKPFYATCPRPIGSLSPVFSELGSRSALYGDCEDYVLIEPGQDEVFVDLAELRARLRRWLEDWPSSTLPADLARFNDLDEAVTYLVESACELDISDGSGTVQWFEVRL